MKNIYIFPVLFLLTFSLSIAQNIPNGGFEEWEYNEENILEPVNWQTNNLDDVTFVYQETGHAGQFAAKLSVEWLESLGMNMTPALYYHGYFPVSQRFTSLDFYMLGETLNDDYLAVNIGMYHNGILIGNAIGETFDDYFDWASVSVPISYGNDEVPDECFISFAIWPADACDLGSYCYLDNLELAEAGGITGSWQVIASGVEENLYSVHFANANTGYIGGGMGRFMKSVNSGFAWSSLPLFSYAELFTVCATSPDDVHVGGWDTIYRSQNGGQSWNGVYINTVNYYVLDMQFHSASLGYAFLQASAFKKTTDGGNSWSAMTGSGVIDDFLAGYMIDETNGFAVGGAGLITHTNDGGLTWPQYEWNGWTEWSPIDIEGVHFTSLSNGFAVADSGILLRTTNGGEHWTKSYIAGPEDRLKDIFFLNASLGWIVGYHGKIFSTSDGGNTWNAEPVITSQDLNSVFFISSNLGWVVGNNGTILRFGEPSSSVNDTGLLPDEAIHIFPNPFSSITSLNIRLKESMNVSVEIFDIAGRKCDDGFSGELPAGSNLLQLDGSGLNNGLYYCRIASDRGNVSKPFIINR